MDGSSVAKLPLKGLARAVRAAVLKVNRHDVLTRDAEESFFRNAEVLSEGSADGDRYQGSTMITVDLAKVAAQWREPFSDETVERVFTAMERSVRVHLRAIRLARDEVQRRCPGVVLDTAQTEVRVGRRGSVLHVDVDMDVPFLAEAV